MNRLKFVIFLLILCGISACASRPEIVRHDKAPDILTVHRDGTLEFRNRLLHEDDVIIYSDGRGGERAAVKVRVPFRTHGDFYRDSIVVERLGQDEIPAQN